MKYRIYENYVQERFSVNSVNKLKQKNMNELIWMWIALWVDTKTFGTWFQNTERKIALHFGYDFDCSNNSLSCHSEAKICIWTLTFQIVLFCKMLIFHCLNKLYYIKYIWFRYEIYEIYFQWWRVNDRFLFIRCITRNMFGQKVVCYSFLFSFVLSFHFCVHFLL